jgi:hypothetical protein
MEANLPRLLELLPLLLNRSLTRGKEFRNSGAADVTDGNRCPHGDWVVGSVA